MTEQSSKKALQFGAGNIGRGFIGVLLSRAGYAVTFVDVVDTIVTLINQRGKYTITEVEGSDAHEVTIEHVKAINGKAEAEVAQEISQASLITTAVGPGILPIIARAIARGLRQRAEQNLTSPLNIIACENLIDNSRILQKYVLEHIPSEHQPYLEKYVGFPRCVVDKVVTTPTEAERERDPLSVIAEGHGLLIVERQGFAGEPPVIAGLQLTDNLSAYVEQKIFTLNTAHAVTAYLAYPKGYEFVHEALQDSEIRRIVLGVIEECSAALVKRHKLDPDAQKRYAETVLQRFDNSALADPIIRVAREPKRKLAPNDRLIKPAVLALENGITPVNLIIGIAAALTYHQPDDKEAVELQHDLKENGLDSVLAEVCGLTPHDVLTQLIKQKMGEEKEIFG